MKFGKTFENYKDKKTKTCFAWLPIRINGEVRWLEKVTLRGYYYVGMLTGKVRFMKQGFIDKPNAT